MTEQLDIWSMHLDYAEEMSAAGFDCVLIRFAPRCCGIHYTETEQYQVERYSRSLKGTIDDIRMLKTWRIYQVIPALTQSLLQDKLTGKTARKQQK